MLIFFKHKIMKKDKEHDYDISALGDASDLLIENPEETSEEEFSEEEIDENLEGTEEADDADADAEGAEVEETDEKDEEKKTEDEATEEAEPEEADKRKSMAVRLLNAACSIFNGDFSEEEFLPLLDACEAKHRIEEAYKAGEIAGRNSQIEEMMATPEEIVPDLVGTPNLNRRPEASIFDIARMARF